MKAIRPLLSLFTSVAIVAGARAAGNSSVLIPRYERVAAALVADNLADAKSAAQALAADAGNDHHDTIAGAARAIARAADLGAAREAFKTLSARVIVLARHEKGYFIINCPMADADWLQSTRKIANPYFGQAMSGCGLVTEETTG